MQSDYSLIFFFRGFVSKDSPLWVCVFLLEHWLSSCHSKCRFFPALVALSVHVVFPFFLKHSEGSGISKKLLYTSIRKLC
jgi:hypothetical protein